MVDHFFEAVAQNAKMNMHAHVYGDNDHHKIEALFKAFAYALRRAIVVEEMRSKAPKECFDPLIHYEIFKENLRCNIIIPNHRNLFLNFRKMPVLFYHRSS